MILKHIVGWLVVTVLVIFGLPALVSPTAYVSQVKREQSALVENFGAESAQKIIVSADKAYTEAFEDSGLHKSFMEHYSIPEKDILSDKPAENDPLRQNAMAKYERKMQAYFVGLFVSFYEWIFRMVQLLMWCVFALPFLVAAAWDGLMLRKVRAASFIYSSPSIYSGLWHALIAMFFGANVLLNIPFTVKPLIYPIILAMFALLIRTLLANLQRSA